MADWRLSEQDKGFLMALAYAVGVVMLWKGIWEGSNEIPILANPWVSLFLGLAILSLTGWLFGQFDVFSLRINKLSGMVDDIIHQARKGIIHEITYYDEITGKQHKIPAKNIKRVESGNIVVHGGTREQFIPLHRISHVKRGGKTLYHNR